MNTTTLLASQQLAPDLATLSHKRQGTHWTRARRRLAVGPTSSEEAHGSNELQLAGHTYQGTSPSPVSVWYGGQSTQPSVPTHAVQFTALALWRGPGAVWGHAPAQLLGTQARGPAVASATLDLSVALSGHDACK